MNRSLIVAAGLAFLRMAQAAVPDTASFELAVVDMQGQKKVLGKLPGSVVGPRISPDGRKVAFEQVDDPPADPKAPPFLRPYVADLDNIAKPEALQPTLLTNVNRWPEWSFDRDWIVFAASGNGSDSLFKQRADGWIQPKYVVDGRAPEGVHEGWLLLFLTLKGEKDYGVATLDMNTNKILQRFDIPGSAQYSSDLSRDGKWVAITSDETGRPEIFVQSMNQSQRVQLTTQGGAHPQWSPDGRKIYYYQGGRIFSIDVSFDGNAPRAASQPAALPVTGFQQDGVRRQFDLMPDGKGFLMLFPASK